MSNVTTLTTALSDEFAGSEISFSATPPNTFTSPSVVVTPADPHLITDTHGMVREVWEVLVVVSLRDVAKGLSQMRQNSLRVMRAVHTQGAVWKTASAPHTVPSDNNKSLVASKNRVEFRYQPAEELPEN